MVQNGLTVRRLALIAAVLFACAAGLARPALAAFPQYHDQGVPLRPHFRVFVIEDFPVSDLKLLEPYGAVGLLVPGVGALTDRHVALESLVRGADVNPYLHFKVHPKQRAMFRVVHRVGLWPLPKGPTIVLALPPGGPLRSNETRYPIAILGGNYHGLLTSPTTRIPGLVSITDVAPTALGHVRGFLGDTRALDPVPQLRRLDGQISANNRLKLATLIILACTLVLLAFLRPAAALPAVLAALAVNLVAGATHVASEPLLVTMMFLGTVVGGLLIARVCALERGLLVAILAVLVLYAVLMALRPAWVAITPLGPTQNARFWGIGNQLETLLLAPMLTASVLAHRLLGPVGFIAVALASLAVMTDNSLGADGGGAITLGVALALVASRRMVRSLSGFVTALAAAGGAVVFFVDRGLAAGGPDHLRSAFDGGVGGLLDVLVNRIPLAYEPAVSQWQLAAPLAAIAVAVAVAASLRARTSIQRDVVYGLVAATAVSLVVNDSAAYILAGAIAAFCMAARLQVVPAERLRFAFGLVRQSRLDES